MRTLNTIGLAGVALLMLSPPLDAQCRPHCRPGVMAQDMDHTFNPATVEVLEGVVARLDRVTMGNGMGAGIHLILERDGDTVPVHLGPAWFLDRQEDVVAAGDEVRVRASRVTINGETAYIAAELHKGDRVMTLRDAQGRPAWVGWRRRGPTSRR